jgi:hypothetical protein
MKKITRYLFSFSLIGAMSVLTVLALRDRVNVLTGGDAKTYTLTLDDANLKDMPTDTAATAGLLAPIRLSIVSAPSIAKAISAT